MSLMAAELGPIPSDKMQLLLNKEQIVKKIDENPEIQMIQETCENMSTSEQNPDVLGVGEDETVD